ncbi:MAG: PA14 domain-containing protein [Planctomycetota bacterium]
MHRASQGPGRQSAIDRARWLLATALLAAACGDASSGPPASAAPAVVAPAVHGRVLADLRGGRCVECHDGDVAATSACAPPPRLPLAAALPFRAGTALAAHLREHHGGDDAAALTAFLRAAAGPQRAPAAVAIDGDAFARGERAWWAFACIACHPAAGIDGLAQRTGHAALVAFLQDPVPRRPDLLHDFALDERAAGDLAAWLLRAQRRDDPDAAATQGLRASCYELRVDSEELPALDGLTPSASGVVESVDVALRTRDDHFALRFDGHLLVPASGDWTFTLGSDDASWLWIDDALVLANADLAPHRRRRATVPLDAGAHALRVVYTEAEGEQSLELLWAGPGVERAPVPPSALTPALARLVPPIAEVPAVPGADGGDADLVGRGRAAYAARRCGACHELAEAPPPQPARAWRQLGAGECPTVRDAAALARQLPQALAARDAAAVLLCAELEQNGCRRCHARDGAGGLGPALRALLPETEDLGDEGRVPPDLSGVGRRLRERWIEGVLTGAVRARPYVTARMPRAPQALATALARRFAQVDGGDDEEPAEPPFAPERIERGRELVGTGGKNCVTCHPFAGRRALGPQGMDLAQQFERLRPGWFADWLLRPHQLRPGTRMPMLWSGGAEDRADADAVRAWCRLGAAAPVPRGYAANGDYALDPVERPILHGAFFRGLSSRCLAVGSPQRGHYVYDVEHARLAWLWRGAFLDAAGTWHGRAGKLLQPLDDDRVELDELELIDVSGAATGEAVAGRRCTGQGRDQDGMPSFRVAVGASEVDDRVAPRLTAAGIEFARTLRAVRGAVRVELRPRSGGAAVTVGGAPAAPVTLRQGEAVEVVYRW